jgi:hypothetical protein
LSSAHLMDAVQLFDDLSVSAEGIVESAVAGLSSALRTSNSNTQMDSSQIEEATLNFCAERLRVRYISIIMLIYNTGGPG